MATEQELLRAYQCRYIEHSLISAAGYLTHAAVDAARAHEGLHWLSSAKTNIGHALEALGTFQKFVAAIDASDGEQLDSMNAEHDSVLRQVTVSLEAEGL